MPYSAAQQPVQCRLHAEVGSSKIAHGMLQPYFLRYSSCFGQPMILALRKKFSNSTFSTAGSASFMMRMMSLYMLFVGSFTMARTTSRWGSKLSGPVPAKRSTQAISFGRFSSGSRSR